MNEPGMLKIKPEIGECSATTYIIIGKPQFQLHHAQFLNKELEIVNGNFFPCDDFYGCSNLPSRLDVEHLGATGQSAAVSWQFGQKITMGLFNSNSALTDFIITL